MIPPYRFRPTVNKTDGFVVRCWLLRNACRCRLSLLSEPYRNISLLSIRADIFRSFTNVQLTAPLTPTKICWWNQNIPLWFSLVCSYDLHNIRRNVGHLRVFFFSFFSHLFFVFSSEAAWPSAAMFTSCTSEQHDSAINVKRACDELVDHPSLNVNTT